MLLFGVGGVIIMMHSVPCILTVGNGKQCAVRCVHVTRCHIVPLSRPVNGGIVLDIKLLENKEQDINKQGKYIYKTYYAVYTVYLNEKMVHVSFQSKTVKIKEKLHWAAPCA